MKNINPEKINRYIAAAAACLELVVAAVVFIAIIIAIVSLQAPVTEYIANRFEADAFIELIHSVLDIVIGIEFLKMLCNPTSDTVLEVLMFAAARHMLVHDTTALEDLVVIGSILLILVVRKYLHEKNGRKAADASDES